MGGGGRGGTAVKCKIVLNEVFLSMQYFTLARKITCKMKIWTPNLFGIFLSIAYFQSKNYSFVFTDSGIEVCCYTSINENCSNACWCRQMRQWISRQLDRNLDILTIDTYYRQNNQNMVSKLFSLTLDFNEQTFIPDFTYTQHLPIPTNQKWYSLKL